MKLKSFLLLSSLSLILTLSGCSESKDNSNSDDLKSVQKYGVLFNEDDKSITKESRRYNYSIQLGLKEGEKLNVNVPSEIAGALKNKKIWSRLFISDNFKKKFKNPMDLPSQRL